VNEQAKTSLMLQSLYIEVFLFNHIKYPHWRFKLYKVCTFWSIGTNSRPIPSSHSVYFWWICCIYFSKTA